HCTEHISLTDVAESVYVSQWHLSKLINRHTGQSFLDLLGSMRIERAKELLADPAMRVHAVAEEVGYSDVAHFSKSFKKIVGKTPGEYRATLSG
ncbi:MAG: helix-turn-helix transcriptional regulator, partial [Aristaeellaceae bacterium]